MMETMIPPQVGMRLRMKNKKIKKEGEKESQKNKKQKKREKREKGQCYYPFSTLASKWHHDLHDRESLMLSLSYTSGNFSL